MIDKLKRFFEFSNKTGLYIPLAYDANREAPSITLMIFFISGIITITSLILLHFFPQMLTATSMSILFTAMSFVMYRVRHIDKLKFDLDDKSFELHTSNDKKN